MLTGCPNGGSSWRSLAVDAEGGGGGGGGHLDEGLGDALWEGSRGIKLLAPVAKR